MTATFGTFGGSATRDHPLIDLEAPLREAWALEIWAGDGEPSMPALADGPLLFVNAKRDRLVAVDRRTGRTAWKHRWGGRPVLVDEGRLFVAGPWDQVQVVDSRDGRLLTVIPWPHVKEMVADRDVLYGQGSNGEYGLDCVGAVDPRSGRRLWTQFLPSGRELRHGICVGAGHVVFGEKGADADDAVIALRVADGNEAWRWQFPAPAGERSRPEARLMATPAVFGDVVVVPIGNRGIVGLSAGSGEMLWHHAGSWNGTLHGGEYYAIADSRTLRILDPMTGQARKKPDLFNGLPKSARGEIGPPLAVSRTHVFVGVRGGWLAAFDRKTWKSVWMHRPPSTGRKAAIVAVDGALYYFNGLNRLFALEAAGAARKTAGAAGR
jgi:outer membrane protein assembly factor BamB